MPKGIAIIKWDDHYGAMLDSAYPEDLKISKELVLQLYTSQTMGDISTPRFSSFQTKEIRVASYFGGEKKNILLIFVLNEDEDPERFKLFLIQTFNDYISNSQEIQAFLKQNHEKLLHFDEMRVNASILENKKFQNLFFNVINEDIRIFQPKKDINTGIHYPQLSRFLEVEPNQTELYIDYLTRQNFLIPEIIDNIFACPSCGSMRILNKILCPECQSKKIEKNVAAQHKFCGHIDFYKNFFDKNKNRLLCTKCNSLINQEVDLSSKGITFKCMECGIFFKKGEEIFECNNCMQLSKKDDLIFKPIFSYKANLEQINLGLTFQEDI